MSREVTAALALTAALRGKLPPTIQIFFFLSLSCVLEHETKSNIFLFFNLPPPPFNYSSVSHQRDGNKVPW